MEEVRAPGDLIVAMDEGPTPLPPAKGVLFTRAEVAILTDILRDWAFVMKRSDLTELLHECLEQAHGLNLASRIEFLDKLGL